MDEVGSVIDGVVIDVLDEALPGPDFAASLEGVVVLVALSPLPTTVVLDDPVGVEPRGTVVVI